MQRDPTYGYEISIIGSCHVGGIASCSLNVAPCRAGVRRLDGEGRNEPDDHGGNTRSTSPARTWRISGGQLSPTHQRMTVLAHMGYRSWCSRYLRSARKPRPRREADDISGEWPWQRARDVVHLGSFEATLQATTGSIALPFYVLRRSGFLRNCFGAAALLSRRRQACGRPPWKFCPSRTEQMLPTNCCRQQLVVIVKL